MLAYTSANKIINCSNNSPELNWLSKQLAGAIGIFVKKRMGMKQIEVIIKKGNDEEAYYLILNEEEEKEFRKNLDKTITNKKYWN